MTLDMRSSRYECIISLYAIRRCEVTLCILAYRDVCNDLIFRLSPCTCNF